MPKRVALAISLSAIALLWIWHLATRNDATAVPEQFSTLVLQIARNKVIMLASMFVLLRLEGEGFEALGLRRAGWMKQVAVGLGFGLLMFVALNFALSAALQSVFPPAPTAAGKSILDFFVDPRNLLAWLPIGIFGGGVVEELERIFILTRFEKWLGRPGLVLGVITSSLMFGVGHLYQGVGSALSIAVSGLVFSLLYLRRRSALEPITAHAWSDVLAMLAATFLRRH